MKNRPIKRLHLIHFKIVKMRLFSKNEYFF
jgi:hypothetical protein